MKLYEKYRILTTLFQETKQKTKRILLEKLGSESVEWGHTNLGFSGTQGYILCKILCGLVDGCFGKGMVLKGKLRNENAFKSYNFWVINFENVRIPENLKHIGWEGEIQCHGTQKLVKSASVISMFLQMKFPVPFLSNS